VVLAHRTDDRQEMYLPRLRPASARGDRRFSLATQLVFAASR
jgi:hypothetical protein